MKNLILITFLLIFFGANAQTTKPIDGFLGIKFGSSAAEVTEALKAKGGVVRASSPTSITFTGLTLGNKKIGALFVHFMNDKALEAVFAFLPEQEAQSIEFYNTMVSAVSDAYGPGKITKTFKPPYEDGDGYEITAIKSGNANYHTSWIDGDNTIDVYIEVVSNKISIRIYYIDGKLQKIYKDQQKEKNKSEF